jgi:hypothetical protein
MEALREAVQFVEIEQARRFTNRALPMGEAESTVFDDTLALWDAMHLGYQYCLQAVVAGEPGIASEAGLVCQRALLYMGLKMFHYHRAYRQVSPREWRALHAGYARAEELGVADEEVKDYLNRDVNDTSPRIAYTRALLLGMASPNELSQRQLTFVAFLLERWAEKVEISREAPEEDVPPLVADLESELCPERGSAEAAEPRYLDVKRLGKSLRNRIGLLRKGESPAKLALGEDCVQPRKPATTWVRSTITFRGTCSSSRARRRRSHRRSAIRSPPSAGSARATTMTTAWCTATCSSTGRSRTRVRRASSWCGASAIRASAIRMAS